jgi:hypothetical protein
MTTFDDREHAFEAHFAFEEELEFKVRARRDRLVGLWAGGLMGLKDAALEAYVAGLLHADLSTPGTEEVYQKVVADFGGQGVAVRPQEVRARIGELTLEAREHAGADPKTDHVPGA